MKAVFFLTAVLLTQAAVLDGSGAWPKDALRIEQQNVIEKAAYVETRARLRARTDRMFSDRKIGSTDEPPPPSPPKRKKKKP